MVKVPITESLWQGDVIYLHCSTLRMSVDEVVKFRGLSNVSDLNGQTRTLVAAPSGWWWEAVKATHNGEDALMTWMPYSWTISFASETGFVVLDQEPDVIHTTAPGSINPWESTFAAGGGINGTGPGGQSTAGAGQYQPIPGVTRKFFNPNAK